jgi:hypothetical protein
MVSESVIKRIASMLRESINNPKESGSKGSSVPALAAQKVAAVLKGNTMKKGGLVKKSSDTMGRAVKRKTADVKGRAMKKGK